MNEKIMKDSYLHMENAYEQSQRKAQITSLLLFRLVFKLVFGLGIRGF